MKAWQRSLLCIILGFIVLVSFNNCGTDGFSVQKSPLDSAILSSEGDDPPPDDKTGIALYIANCASCHGGADINLSTKKGRTAEQITVAISNQPSMRFLSTLTTTEINQIAIALDISVPPVDPPPPTGTIAKSQAVIGNRYYIASNLSELFITDGTPDTSDTQIATIIQTLIKDHPEAFGGNCNRNDLGCQPKPCLGDSLCLARLRTSMEALPLPSASPIGKGYTMRVCEEIISIDKATITVLAKAGLSTASEIGPENVLTLMRFMHRDRPVDSVSADELVKVANQAKAKGFSILEQWKFMILPICYSGTTDLL